MGHKSAARDGVRAVYARSRAETCLKVEGRPDA
jgi:hypothetical protein